MPAEASKDFARRNVAHLCLILWTQVRIRQPRRHVQHEGVVKFAHLIGDVDVLAASLDDNLPKQKKGVGLDWLGCAAFFTSFTTFVFESETHPAET